MKFDSTESRAINMSRFLYQQTEKTDESRFRKKDEIKLHYYKTLIVKVSLSKGLDSKLQKIIYRKNGA